MTRKAAIDGTGKLKANKTAEEGRAHGTRWRTGAKGVLTADVVKEFASYGMSLVAIAYLIGVSKQDIYAGIKDDPELQQAWCEGVAELICKAGKCLSKKIDDGDLVSTIFTLKSKHLPNERGWVEAQYIKEPETIEQPKVSVFLPWNGRDELPEGSFIVKDGLVD